MTHRFSLIDQILAEAHKSGLYDPDAAGNGALIFDDVTHVDPADRAGYQLLKSNGFAPPLLEERNALLREHGELTAALIILRARYSTLSPDKQTLLLHETRAKLTDIWRRTMDYNLVAPLVLHIAGIRVDYELTLLQTPINAADAP